MKILVVNGSPKRDRSDCMRLTRAFLEGMGETAEVVNAVDLHVKPCLGCFGCWYKTPGACVQKDDMASILDKIVQADLVIWSMPLYCYGMPAPVKAIVDRLLPLNMPEQAVDEDGRTYHPSRGRGKSGPRFMLISGSGFPNIEHNFEGLLFQFGMLFGKEFPRILCVESPLLNIPDAAPVADSYLALMKAAGGEFRRDGAISPQTQEKLDQPMYPPDAYRAGK